MNIECTNKEVSTLSRIKVGGFFESSGLLYVKCSGITNNGCCSCLEIASQTLVYLRGSHITVPANVTSIKYKV